MALKPLTWGWYDNESSARLTIITCCVRSPRPCGTGSVKVRSYERNHGQCLPEAHGVCDNFSPKWWGFLSLMGASNSIDEAV
jgi:hypothetical protein